MKGSQGITTDVNTCFINYEMIKTHMIKTNYSIVWIKIAFIKWMHISCLFRDCIILRCVRFFLIFSLNYQQGVTRCCIRIDKWEEITKSSLQTNQKQTYIYLDLEKVHRLKGLTFPYIISYLHFLNLNNILTHPQTLVVAEAGFSLTRMMFALFFACQIYTHAR